MYDYNNNCILCMVFSHPAYLIVYYHCAYLIYMQSTFMQNAELDEGQLESRLPGEISITSDMQMTPNLWQKVKNN